MDKREPAEVDPVLESVSPEVFDLVSAVALLELRPRLEASGVPFYRVTGRAFGRYQVVAAHWKEVETAAGSATEFALARQWSRETLAPVSSEEAFQTRWNALMAMTAQQRVQELAKNRQAFEVAAARAPVAERAALILGITETAFLVNRASMSVNQTGLAHHDSDLVRETTEIIRAVVALVSESELAITLFQTLKSLSSGHTLDHVVRVFSLMVGFLHYYNTLHSRGLNQKLRAAFVPSFREAYRALLPDLSDSLLTFDNVVRLPALSDAKVQIYALGALMHDVGKTMDLGYFEGDAVYDATRIKQHPIIGSGLFLKAYGTRYEEARSIVGNHHHYLGHRDGYGVLRWEQAKSGRTVAALLCSVSDDLGAFVEGRALTFLPVELCSVADVYDALTDPSRRYRDTMAPEKALQFMHENFLQTRKIDPVVFALFADFLAHNGETVPAGYGLPKP